MVLDILLSSAIFGAGLKFFGHFEEKTSLSRRISRVVVYIGLTALLSKKAGHGWARAWALGLPLLGCVVHFSWCLYYGINPLTAEPRDKYAKLRGWKN